MPIHPSPLTNNHPWHLGPNDPSVMGWVVAAAYLGAAVVCGLAARRAARGGGSERVLWLGLAVALAALALNKQLDLHSVLKAQVGGMAVEHGWHGERRKVLAIFMIGAIAAVGVAGVGLLVRLPRESGRCLRLALAAFFCLAVVLLLRFVPIGAPSRFLNATLFESLPEIWQFHAVELFELLLAPLIGIAALRRGDENHEWTRICTNGKNGNESGGLTAKAAKNAKGARRSGRDG